MVSSTTAVQLGQYAPQLASLFNNMKTPAAILAGATVPIGFAAPLPLADANDSRVTRILRRMYPIMVAVSLSSTLISIMWSTVTVNQLTETEVAKAESVWHLIKRDYELPWAGVNAHFIVGMLAFAQVIATRGYFVAGQGRLGMSVAGLASSAWLMMISIVNRAVASGGGSSDMRYGSNFLSVCFAYSKLMVKRTFVGDSFGPLELVALLVLIASSIGAVNAIFWEGSVDAQKYKPA